MERRVGILVGILAGQALGCGRLEFESTSDATDAPGGCWPAWHAGTLELSPPRSVVAELGGLVFGDPFLAADGRLFTWGVNGGIRDVYAASREARDTAWNTAVVVPSLSSAGQDYRASFSADGLVAAISSARAGNIDVWLATRDDPTALFFPPTQDRVGPLATPEAEHDAELSADGLTLYFSRGDARARTLLRSTRATRTDAFGSPETIAELSGPYNDPSISPDERVIAFTVIGTSTAELVYATRSRRQDPFGASRPIPIPNPSTNYIDVALAPDGCEVYFVDENAGFALLTSTVR